MWFRLQKESLGLRNSIRAVLKWELHKYFKSYEMWIQSIRVRSPRQFFGSLIFHAITSLDHKKFQQNNAIFPKMFLAFSQSLTRRTPRCFHFPIASAAPAVPRVAFYSSINEEDTIQRVERVLAAKTRSGLSYDELAAKLGVTNAYCAQLLLGQAKLTPTTAEKLQDALNIPEEDLQAMQTTSSTKRLILFLFPATLFR